MSVFLHCKIAYTTEENVCFALLNRIMHWNYVMSTLLQSSPLILYKSCLPFHATHITSDVTLSYQLEQTMHSKLEMGKNPHCSGSVLFGFFLFFLQLSSIVLFGSLTIEFYFRSVSVLFASLPRPLGFRYVKHSQVEDKQRKSQQLTL